MKHFWLESPMSTAVAYMRGELSDGTNLSKFLLELPLEDGFVVPYTAKVYLDDIDMLAYEEGSAAKVARPKEDLPKLIARRMINERSCVVFEDICLRADDPPLPDLRKHFFTHKEHVYYFMGPKGTTGEKVNRMIRSIACRYPLIGIVCLLPDGVVDLEYGVEVSSSFLHSLARSTTHLLVGAFDDVGFLVWQKSSKNLLHLP